MQIDLYLIFCQILTSGTRDQIVALIAFHGGLWLCCCRNDQRFGRLHGQYALMEYAFDALVQFSNKELKGLTIEFKERLGGRSFGPFYRGMHDNGMVVVVKQLERVE